MQSGILNERRSTIVAGMAIARKISWKKSPLIMKLADEMVRDALMNRCMYHYSVANARMPIYRVALHNSAQVALIEFIMMYYVFFIFMTRYIDENRY